MADTVDDRDEHGASTPGELIVHAPAAIAHAPRGVARYARRVSHTARNIAEVVRFGGLDTDDESAPYAVAAERSVYRLRHYFADDVPPGAGLPVLFVPPLMMTTEVFDVSAATSAVRKMHAEGNDVWVVDFGHPDREPGGLERTLTDHVLAVSDAIDRVAAETGEKVVLAGYSQGGMFAYQAAAYRRGDGLDSMVTFGSPVDTTAPLPLPLPPELVSRLAGDIVDSGMLRNVSMPGWMARLAFKLVTPAKSAQSRVQFLLALHDRDALLPREKQRRFLDSEGWTSYSGPAIAELLEQFVTHNRMLEGGFVIDDRLVTLADIALPVLTVVGTNDTIGNPVAVRAIRRAAPKATVYELTVSSGHFGLVVGTTANEVAWPAVADWIRWRHGDGALPETVVEADTVAVRTQRVSQTAVALAQATELGIAIGRIGVRSARRAGRVARSVVRDSQAQLPRLSRIEAITATTRISLGLLLDEQAHRAPDDIAFLFGDRAHRQYDVKHRVDSIVRGLISIGVRQGDHVGVLMDARPSAFTLVTALSRLGATAVLLRPDGDPRREAALGEANWVISDPEHVAVSADIPGVRWAVLGGGGPEVEQRARWHDDHPDVVDMETIDPDDVALPAWFSPNPHLAADVAFVLFSGEGPGTRALHITNGRWARSALGTASAAALHPGHTVLSTTPIYHSSALLMCVGGTVAGGARYAMASGEDPDTFWDEVRRYGATHVSYTWTSLDDIVEAPPRAAEQHNPIRMFLGSGMPPNLWRRVTERFPGTTVLEFYASAEGEAILANLAGRNPGSMGRPLPGTAEVRVAGFDQATRRLRTGPDGLAREALTDEIGLLLARVSPLDVSVGSPLRGVFAAGDAWRSTGDLFLRDQAGDLWLAGPVSEIVDTADGPVLPSGARYALSALPASDLVVAYGVPEDGADVLVAAMTVRPGTSVTQDELDRTLDKLPEVQRPRYVQVVASIPVTTWHRPLWRALARKGVPTPSRTRTVWKLTDDRTHYRRVS